MTVDVSDVRRRVRLAIAEARRAAASRRAAVDEAAPAFERFLRTTAVPACWKLATALRAEGHGFDLATPEDRVMLVPERAREDYLEIAFDAMAEPPAAVGRVRRTRGRRVVQVERPLRADVPIAGLSEEDVLAFLLAEIGPFVDR